MLPILNVQKHLDEEETSGWTIEATDAFQKIKRILDKLPTLVVPKEGEQGRNLWIKREATRGADPNAKGIEDICGKRNMPGGFRCRNDPR
ncbi:hypothetical protein Tco_0117639 [Tanacetum coccineum]